MPSFSRQALAISAALMLMAAPALAVIDVVGNAATFVWTSSSGPVDFYTVYQDRNGQGFSSTISAFVLEPTVTVHGELGETLRIYVIAWSWDGRSLFSSQPSSFSERVRFVDANGSPSPPANPTPPPPTPEPTPPPTPEPTPPPASPDPPPPAGSGEAGALPYDLNGDGRTDLLWQHSRTGEAAAWLMDGPSPSVVAEFGRLRGRWHFIGSGDFDGDGRADLLLQWGRAGTVEIWFMNGWFRGSASLKQPSRCRSIDAIGDFDGDGHADLLWQCRRKSVVSFMRGASVEAEVEGPEPAGDPVCALDLDGDGADEVVWQEATETVAWWMLGSPFWRSERVGPQMSDGHEAVGCGDADGDGLDDILWLERSEGEAVLWKMTGAPDPVRFLPLPPLERDWTMDAAGDLDGDGRASEIVVRDKESGEIEIWTLHWNGQLTGFTLTGTADPGMGSGDWEVISP